MRPMLEMLSELKFDRGDTVYHVTATERCAGMVARINIHPEHVSLNVIWPDRQQTPHYPCELTKVWEPSPEVELQGGAAA